MSEPAEEPEGTAIEGAKIPDGALVTAHASACQFIDPETGELRFSVSYGGDAPLTQILGLLRIADSEIIKASGEW